MKAAVLSELGQVPAPGELDRPEPEAGEQLIEVEAAGMNPVDVNIARGLALTPPLPCAVGLEGIGRTADGRRVYFDFAKQPHGSFAEYCLVAEENLMEIPEGIDAATAMPFGIAGLAAWTGFERGSLAAGETVLVLGASGIVGQIGVQVASRLGAGRVVAGARDEALLARAAELGADATVRLGGEREELVAELKEAAGGSGFDLVLDLLWGEPVAAAVGAMAQFGRIVQVGGSAADVVTQAAELSARPIRNGGISVLGHVNYHASVAAREKAFGEMCAMSLAGELKIAVEDLPLDAVEQVWERQRSGPHVKLVVRP